MARDAPPTDAAHTAAHRGRHRTVAMHGHHSPPPLTPASHNQPMRGRTQHTLHTCTVASPGASPRPAAIRCLSFRYLFTCLAFSACCFFLARRGSYVLDRPVASLPRLRPAPSLWRGPPPLGGAMRTVHHRLRGKPGAGNAHGQGAGRAHPRPDPALHHSTTGPPHTPAPLLDTARKKISNITWLRDKSCGGIWSHCPVTGVNPSGCMPCMCESQGVRHGGAGTISGGEGTCPRDPSIFRAKAYRRNQILPRMLAPQSGFLPHAVPDIYVRVPRACFALHFGWFPRFEYCLLRAPRLPLGPPPSVVLRDRVWP